MNKLWHGALYRISSRLSSEFTADVSCATLVKGPLECVTLPAEEIVSMLGVSSSVSIPKNHCSVKYSQESSGSGSCNSRVASRVYEGLAAIFRPDIWVIEGRRVPHDFVHQLRKAHRVC